MQQKYRTLFETETTGFYEEKKSRFLAFLYLISTEEEVENHLSEIRKTHYNASHHCYAYILGTAGDNKKCSDDGEPQKTAGMPILSCLEGAGVTNVLCIVVRYFGGTLLGTGGLVRAYQSAAKDALQQATIIEKCPADIYRISVDYTTYGKLSYYLSEQNVAILSESFQTDVTVKVPVKIEDTQLFIKAVTDLSQGKANIQKEQTVFFAQVGKKAVLFEK